MTKSHIPRPHVLSANLWIHWSNGDVFLKKIALFYVSTKQLQYFMHLDIPITSLIYGHPHIFEESTCWSTHLHNPYSLWAYMVVRTLYGGKVCGPFVDTLLIRKPIFEWYIERFRAILHMWLVTVRKIDSWFIVVIGGSPKTMIKRSPHWIFKALVTHHSVKQT